MAQGGRAASTDDGQVAPGGRAALAGAGQVAPDGRAASAGADKYYNNSSSEYNIKLGHVPL